MDYIERGMEPMGNQIRETVRTAQDGITVGSQAGGQIGALFGGFLKNKFQVGYAVAAIIYFF